MNEPAASRRFVIQKHQARTLHYDFRLEKDGVFKSWAVPKGVPENPGVKRLAIEVEDHALDFGDFEGEIEPGAYGAGKVEIWDKGTYELHRWTDERISVTLEGRRCRGTYIMIRFQRAGSRQWLLFMQTG